VRKGIFLLLGGAAAILMIAGGCGSGGGSDEVTESSISKPKYVAELDATCGRFDKEIQTDFTVYLKKIEQDETKIVPADIVETILVPNMEEELDEIRSLGAPQGEVAKVEAIIGAIERTLEKREEKPETAMNESFWGDATPLAEKFGLKICGQH
jgi:hypothetical protein